MDLHNWSLSFHTTFQKYDLVPINEQLHVSVELTTDEVLPGDIAASDQLGLSELVPLYLL
jgi:hypothetical protein